jgi:hypothetical protein
MEQYVQHATAQLPTLICISLLLGLGKGGVPGLATVATAATVLTAPSEVPGGLGEFDRVRWIVLPFFILIGSVLLIF